MRGVGFLTEMKIILGGNEMSTRQKKARRKIALKKLTISNLEVIKGGFDPPVSAGQCLSDGMFCPKNKNNKVTVPPNQCQ